VRTATVSVDPATVSIARSLAALARSSARDGGPLVCVTGRAFGDLCDELGSDEAAVRHLARVAANTQRPILVNFATGPNTSRMVAVGPKDWTDEKTAGWVAGRHTELEAAFGPAMPMRLEDL
jgi:hypothetical protein